MYIVYIVKNNVLTRYNIRAYYIVIHVSRYVYYTCGVIDTHPTHRYLPRRTNNNIFE